MDQKGLFDEEEGKSTVDEFEDFEEAPKKSKKNLLLGGLLLIIVALAANFFLMKEEEPAVPLAPVRIPIKEAPVMENVTGVKTVTAGDEVKAKPMVEAKPEVKPEVKPEAGAKERLGIIVGTYAVMYEVEAAAEKLKGIPHEVKEMKKKLMMNRIIAKEVKDKGEANSIVAGLKENGYDPFVVRKKDVYKVYAVSNLNEAISNANKADLEKLGYTPMVEKKEVTVKVYQVIARSKSEKDAKALSVVLKKMGFKPEMRK
jgi:hypothetical protein